MTSPEQPSQDPQDWQSPSNPQGPPQDQPQDQPQGQSYGPQPGQPVGPYGQSPQGMYGQDPYGGYGQGPQGAYGQAPQAFGQAPQGMYGQGPQGYGQGSYDPRYGYYGQPYGPPARQDGTRTHAIVALVVSIVLAMSCYVTLGGIAGAILSGIALSKVDMEPDRARNLLKWTWISIGINVVLIVLAIVGFVIAGVNGAFDIPNQS